ncbi:MAG: Ig-like domain-containing protein [Candidatus Eremiobacteraeota bacterium]|nr:Ig-like domain-containing protein [Candidatus Eremiobacteraeota bacterium]
MSAVLAFASCAGNGGTSASMQAALPASIGARADVVQRGNGNDQGQTFMLPPSSYSPRAGIVRGYDGNMWFGTFAQFGRVTENGTISLFAQSGAFPYLSGGLARGPEGNRNVWYTVEEMNGGAAAVAEVSTPSGQTTERAMPEGVETLTGIAAGPDNAMYAASYGANLIARIPAGKGLVTTYPLPGPVPGRPLNIVLGPDYHSMWFTMAGGGSIGRFDTTTHAITYFPIQTPDAGAIQAFAGSIYFLAGYDRGNEYVGKMSPTGQLEKIVLPAWNGKVRIETLCEGPDGNLWVGGFGALWSISTNDTVFGPAILPGIVEGPSYLAAGSDGNLWMLNDQPASISVYLLHAITTSSSSFALTRGQSAPLTVTESAPMGTIGAKSLRSDVATVSFIAPGSFTVTGMASGTTTIRVTDSKHNFVDIPVTISL